MNERHLVLCASPEWAEYVAQSLLPWVFDGRDLGGEVLELGPGPGRTTDVLVQHLDCVTALELDQDLAAQLRARHDATRVRVVCADATRSPLRSRCFTTVTCFTMLHHVPTASAQDALFAEAARVLRPGGLFIGTDALDTPDLRDLHSDDIFTPVDPQTLPGRLTAAGLTDVQVQIHEERVRFTANAPAASAGQAGERPS